MDSPINCIDYVVIYYISSIPLVTTMELVKYGEGGSTLGIRRVSKYILSSTICTNRIRSQLVGHLLGDGSLIITRTSITPYFVFSQTLKRFDYVWHVF